MQPASQNIDWALQEFRYFDGTYKREAVDFALHHRDEITPRLLAILEDVLAHPDQYLPPEHDHDEDGNCLHGDDAPKNVWSHIYALTLLSHFRETRAHALIAQLFSLPPDTTNALFGDMTTEDLPALLYSTYPGSPEIIKKMLADRKADAFVRSSAATALAYCVAGGHLDRKETLDYLAGFLSAPREKELFFASVANVICDLYPAEQMGAIRKAFAKKLIDPRMIDLKFFSDVVRTSNPEKSLEIVREDIARYLPEDIHQRLEKWAAFREDEDENEDDESELFLDEDVEFDEIDEARAALKVGRNDPCPCGSGKKFKKCCLP